MTIRAMIDWIQVHHPDVKVSVILTLLNNRRREFAARTQINKKLGTITTVSGERYYDFPANMKKVTSVHYNDSELVKAIAPPMYTEDDSLTA